MDSRERITLSLKHVAPLYVASADQEARSGNGISTINRCATFEVLKAVLMKIPVSWDVALFRLVNIITGALKDNRAFIFWVKQSKKCHCLTALFFNMFSQVEIKCQLDTTEVFIADFIACSKCFGQHPANRTHNPQLHTRPAT